MEIVKLNWEIMEGHFGNSWMAAIKGFDVNYFIWIDRNTGKPTVAGMDRKHTTHNSIDEAKQWCQENFEENVRALVIEPIQPNGITKQE